MVFSWQGVCTHPTYLVCLRHCSWLPLVININVMKKYKRNAKRKKNNDALQQVSGLSKFHNNAVRITIYEESISLQHQKTTDRISRLENAGPNHFATVYHCIQSESYTKLQLVIDRYGPPFSRPCISSVVAVKWRWKWIRYFLLHILCRKTLYFRPWRRALKNGGRKLQFSDTGDYGWSKF